MRPYFYPKDLGFKGPENQPAIETFHLSTLPTQACEG